MHQPVEDGGRHGVVAEVLAPVLHDSVGSHHDAVALGPASSQYAGHD